MDEVVFRDLDVWIEDESDTSSLFFNLFVHPVDLVACKVLLIELEIRIVAFGRVLHSPFNIRPDNIKWESIVCEVLISLHEDFG